NFKLLRILFFQWTFLYNVPSIRKQSQTSSIRLLLLLPSVYIVIIRLFPLPFSLYPRHTAVLYVQNKSFPKHHRALPLLVLPSSRQLFWLDRWLGGGLFPS